MIRKVWAVIGSAFFLVIASGLGAGLVPWWISRWRFGPPWFGITFFRFAGVALISVGSVALLDSFARFALQGVGTPAPVFPTRHLVVTGLYRYVRNPIYLAVLSTILGEAVFLANVTLLEYAGLVGVLFYLFVLLYEEPTLRKTFGHEYEDYCKAVPRWIPRFTAWSGSP
jgi:protein-S-isoprenylcysteine O-methyltransferase Ste14